MLMVLAASGVLPDRAGASPGGAHTAEDNAPRLECALESSDTDICLRASNEVFLRGFPALPEFSRGGGCRRAVERANPADIRRIVGDEGLLADRTSGPADLALGWCGWVGQFWLERLRT
jgi:hypothetical protein